LTEPKLIDRPKQQGKCRKAGQAEPIRLVPRRRDAEVQRCAFFVPKAVVITGNHAKFVLSRSKVRVKGLAASSRLLPVDIMGFELIAKAHLLGDGETQAGVVDFEIAREGRKSNIVESRITLPVGN